MARTRTRKSLLALILVVCALAGAWSAVRLAGPATYASSLGDVRLQVGVAPRSERGVELYVPLADWGLRAAVTGAPVRFAVEPRRIDRTGLFTTVSVRSGAELRRLRTELTDAFRDAALRAALLALAGALAGGGLAVLAWHALGVRGRRLALAPLAAVGLVAVTGAGLAGWTAATWDAQRLERPTYYASGDELERLLAQADQLRRTGERYSDRVDVAIRSIAGLLDEGGGDDDGPDARRILLASDLHNNLLTLPALRRYGRGRPLVLAGDFTINGFRLESELLRDVDTLGRPVVAVSGNHDSPGLMRGLARRGVRVLTHRGLLDRRGRARGPAVREIAGLTFAGFEDPLMYRRSAFPDGVRAALSFGDFPDGHERFLRAVDERWAWWQALPRRPQVLVVHQEGIGRALANLIWQADPDGAPLTVLVGHTHRQRLDRLGPVTVVNSGSVGAGGVFGAGRDAVGMALLDFAPEGGALEATDLVRMDPQTSAASARRVITARPDCDQRIVVCHREPELPDLPSGSSIAAPTGDRSPATR